MSFGNQHVDTPYDRACLERRGINIFSMLVPRETGNSLDTWKLFPLVLPLVGSTVSILFFQGCLWFWNMQPTGEQYFGNFLSRPKQSMKTIFKRLSSEVWQRTTKSIRKPFLLSHVSFDLLCNKQTVFGKRKHKKTWEVVCTPWRLLLTCLRQVRRVDKTREEQSPKFYLPKRLVIFRTTNSIHVPAPTASSLLCVMA